MNLLAVSLADNLELSIKELKIHLTGGKEKDVVKAFNLVEEKYGFGCQSRFLELFVTSEEFKKIGLDPNNLGNWVLFGHSFGLVWKEKYTKKLDEALTNVIRDTLKSKLPNMGINDGEITNLFDAVKKIMEEKSC